MASLYEILNNAHGGDGIAVLSQEFRLTPEQTEAAVTALLPAISTGLKQSTATPEGLGNLFAVMGQKQDLQVMFDEPQTAFGPDGVAAGNDALSVIFGSQDVNQAVIGQAQNFSGVSSSVLQKMLPVLAGIVISGLMRSKSTAAAPAPSDPTSGSLGDILGQIFGRGAPGSTGAQVPTPGSQPAPAPGGGLGDILGQILGRSTSGGSGQAAPAPADAGQGDILGTLLRELAKGLSNGSIKPVIISGGGPIQIPMPSGQPGEAGAPQVPGGDIFGQILRDVLGKVAGGAGQAPQGQPGQPGQSSPQMKDLSDLSKQLGVMGSPNAAGAGVAVFGDNLEAGQDVEQSHIDKIQTLFDRRYAAE